MIRLRKSEFCISRRDVRGEALVHFTAFVSNYFSSIHGSGVNVGSGDEW